MRPLSQKATSYITPDSRCTEIFRIMAILKVETDIIGNISMSAIGGAKIFVIMSVEAFRTELIVFISDFIMCFTSDGPIKLAHARYELT